MPTEIVQPKTYVKTFRRLLGLLALTVGANFVNLGPFSVVVALAIAVAKAALIILFFMEVRYSHPMVWLFATAGSVAVDSAVLTHERLSLAQLERPGLARRNERDEPRRVVHEPGRRYRAHG